MNFLDIILIIPMAYFVYKGYKRGIIFEAAAIAGIILGCYAAIHFSYWVAELLQMEGDSAMLIAFLVTFLGVVVLSRFVGRFAEGILKLVHVGMLNDLLGAVLGLAKAVCILSILLHPVLLIDHEQKLIKPETKESSVFFKPVYNVGQKMTAKLMVYAEQIKDKKLSQTDTSAEE